MYLIRFYLPLRDNQGTAFPPQMFRAVEAELSRRFGGVTAHLQSPARGLWQRGARMQADEVVTFEVLVEQANRSWWADYRKALERSFRQEKVMLTMQSVDVL